MAADTPEKTTIREGLIQVVSAERLRAKPLGGTNAHVVVMHKRGGTLHHYCTLRSSQDRLSVGEQLWGDFVCYVIDLADRNMRIEQDFATSDRITNVHVVADIIYHAVDGEQVALGVDDALASLRENLVTILRREIVRLPLDSVTEENLEARVGQERQRIEARLGIAVAGVRIRVDWPEEVLDLRRADAEERRRIRAEEQQRQREIRREDEARQHERNIELEDIEHIDQIVRRLGMEGWPADFRFRLHSLPRKEALQEIIEAISEQRAQTQKLMGARMQEELAILQKLIDNETLAGPDLEEFGRALLERYGHPMAFDQTLGMPSSVLFGKPDEPKAQLTDGTPERETSSEGSGEKAGDASGETNEAPEDQTG